MIQKYEGLYNEMLADIKRCQQLQHPEKENVESCFWIARNYWLELQKIVKVKGFGNDEMEISFYRNVKPQFASHIEYSSLLAEGLMFVPPWIPFPESLQGKIDEAAWLKTWQESVNDYWTKEEDRGKRFYNKNKSFLDYFENGGNEQDHEYFLARNNQARELSVRRSHNRDTELFTVHEEVLTTWQAYKMYGEYIKKKVNEPVDS